MNTLNKQVAIYDTAYLQKITTDNLKGDVNLILFEDYTQFWKNQNTSQLSKDELQVLIKEGKITIKNLPSLYEKK